MWQSVCCAYNEILLYKVQTELLSGRTDSYQFPAILLELCVFKGYSTIAQLVGELSLKRSSVGTHSGTQVCSDFPVRQIASYGIGINRNQRERENYCFRGSSEGRLKKVWYVVRCWAQSCTDWLLRMSTENAEVMPGWHDGATAAQSQISPSPALCHTSICSSLSLFLPGSVLHSAQIKILSSICHIPGSAPAVSNDPVSPYSVTLRQHSVHPKASHPLPSPSHPLPFSSSVFPSSCSLLLLLLPTRSFSIHILEDIYEHETEHVHLHHFRCRGNLHFLLQPSPVPLLFLI